MRTLLAASLAAVFVVLSSQVPAADELPKLKFNEVREIAPGVFFRYSSISATDKTVPFGGSNNIWVVFEDYVVVIDANFPKEAARRHRGRQARRPTSRSAMSSTRTTTATTPTATRSSPRRGRASSPRPTALACCASTAPRNSRRRARGRRAARTWPRASSRSPTIVFDDKLVLDDGKQRVEFLYFGHAHTAGDAVAYLPKHKILCTGDACVNGAFNYMGHSDSASWIRVPGEDAAARRAS